MKRFNIYIKITLLLAAIIVVISCAINPVTGKRQIMLMSEAQELALGSQYDPQVIATFGEYKSDKILPFLTTKTKEMGKISHRPNLVYHIKILDSPVVNAFTYYGMKQDQMKELALLNNLELTDQVQAGKLIKIIGE